MIHALVFANSAGHILLSRSYVSATGEDTQATTQAYIEKLFENTQHAWAAAIAKPEQHNVATYHT